MPTTDPKPGNAPRMVPKSVPINTMAREIGDNPYSNADRMASMVKLLEKRPTCHRQDDTETLFKNQPE